MLTLWNPYYRAVVDLIALLLLEEMGCRQISSLSFEQSVRHALAHEIVSVCDCWVQRVHGSLLQRSQQLMLTEGSAALDITLLPLALREAAFFESADCYTAMIANREVWLCLSLLS